MPLRRLLCAVRGADQTPKDADANPSTAAGRTSEPTGSIPAERDGLCTWKMGGWVLRRNARALAEGGRGQGQNKSRLLSQIPCGHPERRSRSPCTERAPLALLQGLGCAAPGVARRPMPLQRSAQLLDLMGMVAAERAGLSVGQTHQLLYSDRGQMLLIMVLRELPKRASAPLRLLYS